MKKVLTGFTMLSLAVTNLFAQSNLDAKSTNPEKMKWMKGFPPEKENIISASDGSFFNFPALRYSVNHMREFFPTRNVPAAKDKYFSFKTKIDSNIDNILFVPWGTNSTMTWKESLDENFVDGIIIVHKGKIVYEKYFGGLKEDGIHAAMSVSKSFTGTLASILIAENLIDPNKKIIDYLPELKDSGFANATVQEVLDMTTAIIYSEDYNNPKAEIWEYSAAGNPFRQANYKGPQNYYEYLKTVQKNPNQEHGEAFGYKTVNTEVIGWLISKVTGKCITELISEKIWIPMGAKYDGYYQVDPAGKAFAGGGFDLNLRDMAIFGELIRNEGKLKGKQIIPKEAAIDVSKGGDPKAFRKNQEYPLLKGWSYHNMWWITNNEHKAFMARGVHGQAIYIDPVAEMTIVRFSSNPKSSNKYIDPISIPAYEAVANYLMYK
jgi:CubicO group peptidase (beta-lactamase class C family)